MVLIVGFDDAFDDETLLLADGHAFAAPGLEVCSSASPISHVLLGAREEKRAYVGCPMIGRSL